MSRYGFSPGDSCYKYQLVALISNPATSQSDVWLAKDQATGTDVALKIMDTSFADVPSRLYEAHVGARLKHENLCEVVGADVFNRNKGNPPLPEQFVAIGFEYEPSGSCTRLLSGPGVIPVSQVHRLLRDVLSGLEYLHEQGWQHNDVKPANILIGPYGGFKLTDYGIAWNPTSGATTADCYVPHLAPESIQVAGGAYTPVHVPSASTDIYQLGVTAYRLLNGASAIRDVFNLYEAKGDRDGFYELVRQGKVPDRNTYLPQVPRRLAQIVNKAMSVQPADRYPSAIAMARTLEKEHYPAVWLYDAAGELVCKKGGVEYRIERVPRGKSFDIALVKTFPSGVVRRPPAFNTKGLTPSRAAAQERRIMQKVLKG